MTETLSFWSFLRKFALNMGALMSGAASVPLTFFAIYFPNAPLKLLFAGLAGVGVVGACYLVWRDSLRVAQSTIADLSRDIAEMDETIHDLTSRPRHTAAEQHRLNTARQLLRSFGNRSQMAVTALRHLRNHGSLTFGTFDPPLPPSMRRDDVLWAYNACLPDGLVTVSKDLKGEQIFSIPPAMNDLLDELLYES